MPMPAKSARRSFTASFSRWLRSAPQPKNSGLRSGCSMRAGTRRGACLRGRRSVLPEGTVTYATPEDLHADAVGLLGGVGKKGKNARSLQRHGQAALMLRARPRLASGLDLTTIGDVAA